MLTTSMQAHALQILSIEGNLLLQYTAKQIAGGLVSLVKAALPYMHTCSAYTVIQQRASICFLTYNLSRF